MVKVVPGVSGLLGNLLDDESDLTDLSDLGEAPSSTSGLGVDDRRPPNIVMGSSVPWESTGTRKMVTYKSKRKIPKDIPSKSSLSNRSIGTEPDLQTRLRKRTRESVSSMSPKAKRQKIEKSPSVSQVANSSTPISNLSASSSFASIPNNLDDIFNEKDVVWVKVDLQGDVVQLDEEKGGPIYWWPAQVLGDDPAETTVELFGNPTYSGAPRSIRLSSMLRTVVSFRCDGQLRFDESLFSGISSENPEDVAILPNFIKRWKIALTQALRAEKEEELPDASSLVYEATPSKKQRNALPCAAHESHPKDSPSPPLEPPDENLRIGEEGGELVLASAHRYRPDHWPARVVGRSFDLRTKKWLYEVCYMDNERQKLDRSRFFTSWEPGFATCQMGQWKTVGAGLEAESDNDDEGYANHVVDNPPSPSPSSPDLEDIQDTDEFFEHSLSHQMKYVYPILCRTIRCEYPPAIKDHNAFIKGGKAREGLVQSAANYGQFSEIEVKRITDMVRKTMLRDERWGERIFEDEEGQWLGGNNSTISEGFGRGNTKTNSERYSGKPRPKGCEEYENLSRADRGLYCTDVLLRVAILQLHLFRSGARSSWKRESEERENALYAKGLDLMAVRYDIHWIHEILAMRQIAENCYARKKKRRATSPPTTPCKTNAIANRENMGGFGNNDENGSSEAVLTDATFMPLTRSRRKRLL